MNDGVHRRLPHRPICDDFVKEVRRLRTDRADRHGRVAVDAEEAAQALLEGNGGLPAEKLLRARDVRPPDLRIVLRQGLEDDLTRRARNLDDRLRELEQRELAGVPEVDGEMLSARGEQVEAPHEVVDVAEAPRLRAVAEDRERLVRVRLAYEGRDGPAVVRPH